MEHTQVIELGDLVKVMKTYASDRYFHQASRVESGKTGLPTQLRFWQKGIGEYWDPNLVMPIVKQDNNETNSEYDAAWMKRHAEYTKFLESNPPQIKYRYPKQWMPISISPSWSAADGVNKAAPYAPGDCGIITSLERNYLFIQFGKARGWVPKSYLKLVNADEKE